MGQAQFAADVRADYEKWRRVACEGNIWWTDSGLH
jgi:hypothetical protein